MEYSDNYSKTSGILFRYWLDEPAKDINNNNIIIASADDSNRFK